MARRSGTRRRGERGSVAVELVLLTPLLVAVALLAVLLGRIGTARLQVDSAARQAARAASLARTAPAARRDADATAIRALAGEHLTCARLRVTVDASRFTPGGTVTVRVTCTVDLSDLHPLPVPGQATLTTLFTSPVDTYRAVGAATGQPLVAGGSA